MRIEKYNQLLRSKKSELIKIIAGSNRFEDLLNAINGFISQNQDLREVPYGLCTDDAFYELDLSVRSFNVISYYIGCGLKNKLQPKFVSLSGSYHESIIAVSNAISEEGLMNTRSCGIKTIEDIKDTFEQMGLQLKKTILEEDWKIIIEDIERKKSRRSSEPSPAFNKL